MLSQPLPSIPAYAPKKRNTPLVAHAFRAVSPADGAVNSVTHPHHATAQRATRRRLHPPAVSALAELFQLARVRAVHAANLPIQSLRLLRRVLLVTGIRPKLSYKGEGRARPPG